MRVGRVIAGVVVVGLAASVSVLGTAVTGGSVKQTAAGQGAGCAPTSVSPPQGVTVDGLNPKQLQRASELIAAGKAMAVSARAQQIMLATAMQESTLQLLASNAVPTSLSFPHDNVKENYDSVGLLQQRPSMGWGTVAELMDPATSAKKFLAALLKVPNWDQLPLTQAAQAVQGSGFPDAYAQWEALAAQLVKKLDGVDVGGGSCVITGGLPPTAEAMTFARQLVDGWGKTIDGNDVVLQDLKDTAAGKTITNIDTCGHTTQIDAGLLRLLVALTQRYKLTIWNIVTGHGCDKYYHPAGRATDIGGVTDRVTGKSTNFYGSGAGNDPQVVAEFVNWVGTLTPNDAALGQIECGDHGGVSGRAREQSFTGDVCTHQHIQMISSDPQWGPYSDEVFPDGSVVKAAQ